MNAFGADFKAMVHLGWGVGICRFLLPFINAPLSFAGSCKSFFVKGQMVNIFSCAGQMGSATAINFPLEQKSNHGQCIHEQV